MKVEEMLKEFIGQFNQRFDKMENSMDELKTDVNELKEGQVRIERAVNRIEENQPEDIMAL